MIEVNGQQSRSAPKEWEPISAAAPRSAADAQAARLWAVLVADGVAAIDVDARGRVTAATAAVEQVLGVAPVLLEGELLAQCLPQAAPLLEGRVDTVAQLPPPHGSALPVEARLVACAGGGRTLLLVAAVPAPDVPAAQRELARFRTFFHNAPVALVLADRGGGCEWNPAALEMHGFGGDGPPTADEHPFRLFDIQGYPLTSRDWPLARAFRGETVHALELEVEHVASGLRRRISYFANPLSDAVGTVAHVLLIGYDMTALRRAECTLADRDRELARINAELDELAHVAAHDLRAPLRGVAHLALAIEEDAGTLLDRENRRRLRLLRERVIRMDALLVGLLTYTRLGRGEPGEVRAVSLTGVVEELLEELNVPDGVVVEIAGPLPVLHANPCHLRQVVHNLLEHALLYCRSPAGRVWVAARDVGDAWQVEVADDGPGIPAACRESVFHVAAALRSGGDPTALGLALVRKLVLAYGGHIELTDNQPRGALLRITWPKAPRLVTARIE